MNIDGQPTEQQIRKVRTQGRLLWLLSFVTLMIGIGAFATADGEVEAFGFSLDAKYACFIYFVIGAACLWSTIEARKRGFDA